MDNALITRLFLPRKSNQSLHINASSKCGPNPLPLNRTPSTLYETPAMSINSGTAAELQQIKEKLSDKRSVNASYVAMDKHISDPSTKEKLLAEIQDLFDRATAMTDSFERIKVQLGVVDAQDYKDGNGKPLGKLQPTWIGFQDRFKTLLWRSRDSATDTVSVLRDFTEALIPAIRDPTSSIEEIRSALDDFLRGTQTTVPSQTQTFSKLRDEIAAFSAKCIAFADSRNTELTAQIKSLNDQIAALAKEVEDCDKVVVEMGIVLGATLVAGGVATGVIAATFTALGAAGPGILIALLTTVVVTLIGSLAKLISSLKAGAAASEKLDAKQAEVRELNKELASLQALKSTLETLDQDVKQTYTRLDDFSNYRSLVNQDAVFIREYFTTATKLDETMEVRLKFMESTYKALAVGIKEYASRVSKQNQTTT